MKQKNMLRNLLLVLAALVLIVLAVIPKISFGEIRMWRIIVGVVLLYWMLERIFCGQGIADKLDCLLPLALFVLVFKEPIAKKLGFDFSVRSWLFVAGIVLLSVAFHFIFPTSGNTQIPKSTKDNESAGTSESSSRHNRMASATCYFDASDPAEQSVENEMGQTNVYFQNTDIGDLSLPVHLSVYNRLGETVVHIPATWKVEVKATNSLGEIAVRTNPEVGLRDFTLTGSNCLGSVRIVSD